MRPTHKNKIHVGEEVELITFNGLATAPQGTDVNEDFWQLIGTTGKVISENPPKTIAQDRLLIQFNANLTALGLPCHNDAQNSLWISVSDIGQIS